MTGEIETAATVIAWIMERINDIFTAMDTATFMGISYLNIGIAASTFAITWWGIRRIMDSPKSDS